MLFYNFFHIHAHEVLKLFSLCLQNLKNKCNYLEISQGLTPIRASSTILLLIISGRGRPFTKTPPNWLMPACPEIRKIDKHSQ